MMPNQGVCGLKSTSALGKMMMMIHPQQNLNEMTEHIEGNKHKKKKSKNDPKESGTPRSINYGDQTTTT